MITFDLKSVEFWHSKLFIDFKPKSYLYPIYAGSPVQRFEVILGKSATRIIAYFS